jgi:hypothetical protein
MSWNDTTESSMICLIRRNQGFFVFCERVREEAARWERLHEDALKGKFKHRQKRSEVPWPEVPSDFYEWEPPKKKRALKNGD